MPPRDKQVYRLVRITTIPVSMKVLLKGQIRFMQQNGFQVFMVSSDGPEVKALVEQEGASHTVIPFTRTISPIRDLICLFRLTRFFRKLKPDIVHTHTPKAGLIGMWAAKLSGVPVRIHTIAGLPWMETRGFMKILLRNVEKLTALPATSIFPNSFVQQRYLEDHGIPPGKMKVLGNGSSNGIDTTFFQAADEIKQKANLLRESERIDPGSWVWIFIGRIVNDKGIRELLGSFQKVHDHFPGDRLWILGLEEPELDPLDEAHRKILLEHPGIRTWGFINDVRPYLAASQVLVFPSYREGFPNVPLQAGLMGCALILSDINGCNEIVKNGIDGLLVPPKDIAALSGAMMRMRTDVALRDGFSTSISNKIRVNYDQKKLWNIILGEYRHLLASRVKETS